MTGSHLQQLDEKFVNEENPGVDAASVEDAEEGVEERRQRRVKGVADFRFGGGVGGGGVARRIPAGAFRLDFDVSDRRFDVVIVVVVPRGGRGGRGRGGGCGGGGGGKRIGRGGRGKKSGERKRRVGAKLDALPRRSRVGRGGEIEEIDVDVRRRRFPFSAGFAFDGGGGGALEFPAFWADKKYMASE